MKTTTTFAFLAASLTLAICFISTAQAAPVTFEWAIVGNPRNAGEVQSRGTFGAVAKTYRISKTEVTNAQYTEFLNAVADTDPTSLYNTSMGSSTWGGIKRSGPSGSYTYAVKTDAIGHGPGGTDYTYGNKPVVYVSFFDAMRFTNWLENGQPAGAQGASTTEAGVYSIGNGINEVRNPNATYFIPSEDEWYKAAYYDPNKPGGASYYDYPTSTDLVPDNNRPSSDTGNSANFSDSGYVAGDFTYPMTDVGVTYPMTDVGVTYPMTDVGAYTTSESPYGTFDQGGNVREWNERNKTVDNSPFRGYRGGSWSGVSISLAARSRISGNPTTEAGNIGFRVASIPEPSTMILGAMAAVGLLIMPTT